jgi:integrase
VLLLLCGLRRGEVLGLRWLDVDPNREILHVRQQIRRVAGELRLARSRLALVPVTFRFSASPALLSPPAASARPRTTPASARAGRNQHDSGRGERADRTVLRPEPTLAQGVPLAPTLEQIIREWHHAGHSQRAIARELNIDRRKVRSVISAP